MFALGNAAMNSTPQILHNGSPGLGLSVIGSVSTQAGAGPVMKKCSKCKSELEISFFTKSGNGKRRAICKLCTSNHRKVYNKENKVAIDAYNRMYGAKHRKRLNARSAAYCLENKQVRREKRHAKYWANWEEARERNRQWRASRMDKMNELSRNYYATNAERKRALAKERRKTDTQFRIVGCLRSRLYLALSGKRKSASTKVLIGCDIPFLISHIEKQFTPLMNWDNYGEVWSIDHIRPCASFNMESEEDQRKCFHWSNLQPLTVPENSSKGDKIHPKYNNV